MMLWSNNFREQLNHGTCALVIKPSYKGADTV